MVNVGQLDIISLEDSNEDNMISLALLDLRVKGLGGGGGGLSLLLLVLRNGTP